MDPTTAAFRFGLGPDPSDPSGPGAGDIARMAERLAGPDDAAARHPGRGIAEVLPTFRRVEMATKLLRQNEVTEKDQLYRAARAAASDLGLDALRVTMARAVDTEDALRERLVWFWADHFTVKARTHRHPFMPATLVEDAIRPHLTGRFADMLVAVTLHPAMLIYLDQAQSTGPGSRRGQRTRAGLNENFARELIELHTLGVGAGYTQGDVREMAELLTGLGFDPEFGFVFEPGRAEPGAETVLGRTYRGKGTGPILHALRDLAARPETAAHLARKLAVHFVADAPDPGLVDDLAQIFTLSEGNLGTVTAALLHHPAAAAPEARKVRQPVDFMAAALRALGVGGADLKRMDGAAFRRLIRQPLAAMGQPWQDPRGPDGWPEAAEAWITPQGLAGRIHWGMTAPGRLVDEMPDPVALARRALGPRTDDALRLALSRSESRRDGVGLVFAAPAFNRR